MGVIKAVCISEKKGTVKKDVGACLVIKDFGAIDCVLRARIFTAVQRACGGDLR